MNIIYNNNNIQVFLTNNGILKATSNKIDCNRLRFITMPNKKKLIFLHFNKTYIIENSQEFKNLVLVSLNAANISWIHDDLLNILNKIEMIANKNPRGNFYI